MGRHTRKHFNSDDQDEIQAGTAFNSGCALCGGQCFTVLFFFILYFLRQFLHIKPAHRTPAKR